MPVEICPLPWWPGWWPIIIRSRESGQVGLGSGKPPAKRHVVAEWGVVHILCNHPPSPLRRPLGHGTGSNRSFPDEVVPKYRFPFVARVGRALSPLPPNSEVSTENARRPRPGSIHGNFLSYDVGNYSGDTGLDGHFGRSMINRSCYDPFNHYKNLFGR